MVQSMSNHKYTGHSLPAVLSNVHIPHHLSKKILYLQSVLPDPMNGGIRRAISSDHSWIQEHELVDVIVRILSSAVINNLCTRESLTTRMLHDPVIGPHMFDWTKQIPSHVTLFEDTIIDTMIKSIPLPNRQWTIMACEIAGILPGEHISEDTMSVLDSIAFVLATGAVRLGRCD
jgi:hypothetical protein